jgi:hypothetical protein
VYKKQNFVMDCLEVLPSAIIATKAKQKEGTRRGKQDRTSDYNTVFGLKGERKKAILVSSRRFLSTHFTLHTKKHLQCGISLQLSEGHDLDSNICISVFGIGKPVP